jgi:ABC-type polysaccharide/polyol phosphate transport system ATPase subunit
MSAVFEMKCGWDSCSRYEVRKTLVVLVSHDLQAMPEVRGTVIWLEPGRVRRIGPAARVIAEYTAAMEDTIDLPTGLLSAADRLSLAV